MTIIKKRICIIAVAVVIACLGAALTACGAVTAKDRHFTVMLPEGVGYTLNSDAVMNVRRGETAVFEVDIQDGYEFVTSSVGEYSEGKLVLRNVEYSATIELIVRLSSDIADIKNGYVSVASSAGGGVSYGELAEFTFTPYDNYVVEELYVGGVPFDFTREANGQVKVTQVYDEYTSLYAVCYGKECSLTLGDPDGGRISINPYSDTVRYDDVIDIVCTPDADGKTAYIDVNGDYIYWSDTHSFTVRGDTYISARFANEATDTVIEYDYNGAEYISDIPLVDFAKRGEFVYLKNGFGAWSRDGYTLESWNTEPDGSGERHALGAMIAVPDGDDGAAVLKFYAQYKKQTPFERFRFADHIGHDGTAGYEIVAYTPNDGDAELVLPDVYNGKKVLSVGDGVFDGNNNIKSIVTTAVLENIGDRAFGDMSALDDLYLFDSLRALSNTALDGTALRRLHMNSASKRIYENILETNIVDKHMLVKTSKRQKIVTLSGCSMAKGMCSEMFADDRILKDYDVIHTGVHARYGLGMLMEMTEDYLYDGDIVVLALENYEHLWLTDEGMRQTNAEQPLRLQHFESNYDIYEEFDLVESKAINDILPVLSTYISARTRDVDNGTVYNPSINRSMMNKHGDYTYYRYNAAEGWLGEDIVNLFPSMSFLDGMDRINAWVDKLSSRGVRVCLIFPPIYRYKAYDDEENAALRAEFMSELERRAHFPVLGTIDDMALPYYCFSDWINHPSTEGTKVYTKRFIELLSAAVADGTV